jgi:hypothetical protein
MALQLKIEIDREADGRWIAEVVEVPGAMAYGVDQRSAVRAAKSIALSALSARAQSEDIDSIDFLPVAV